MQTSWPLSPRLKDYLEVQYDLRRVLGEGGMGVVLLATERVLDRPVAVKVLNRHAAEQPELRERFRREARVAARLSHPNIVPLHAFGEVDGELFFVMGFVEGETLAARLKRTGRVDQADALHILREVCDALAIAHSNGIVHRDIKPENVLIEARSGRALLADFGIAREESAATALTGTGIVVGTPHYMSPEQAVSDATVDHRADIYAVGVMAYRMLAGKLPFDGANVREILAQQMVARPRDLGVADPSLSAGVAAAIMRCLEKDPAQRWETAERLREAIAPPDENEPVELPVDLQGFNGSFFSATLISLAGAWVGGLNHYLWRNADLAGLIPMMVIAAPATMAIIASTHVRKYGLSRVLDNFFQPPKWWTLWWPKRFRRPGDVWGRIPWQVRAARTMIILPTAIGAPYLLSFLISVFSLSPERLGPVLANRALMAVPVVTAMGLMACLYGGLGLLYFWARANGHTTVMRRTPWLWEANTSPKWKRADFARILGAPASGPTAIPESVERLGAAIDDGVRALVRDGVLSAESPAVVARDVVAAIGQIDRELEMLAKGGDDAELARLDARIASVQGGDAGLVEMFNRQRDAIAAIVLRQREQRARRERLAGHLRELFVALDDVRQRARAAAPGEITGQLDEVCNDLKRLAVGYDELRSGATTPIG